jgi:hypothetical protein
MNRLLRVVNAVMAVLFLLGLAVQYNDPDPWRWVAIYGAAAVACVLAIRGTLPRWLPLAVAVVAAAWAGLLAPHVVGRVAPAELFREIGMDSVEIEEAREMVGLLLIALWMAVLAYASRVRRPVR